MTYTMPFVRYFIYINKLQNNSLLITDFVRKYLVSRMLCT